MCYCKLCGLVYSDDFKVCPFCLSGHEDEDGIEELLMNNMVMLKKPPPGIRKIEYHL